MDLSRVTVRVNEDGELAGVEVDGHPEPEGVTEMVEPKRAEKPYGDDENEIRQRTWLGI